MKIEKLGELFIVKARFNSRLFTAVESSMRTGIDKVMENIAIHRSVTAWNK